MSLDPRVFDDVIVTMHDPCGLDVAKLHMW